ncbi:MAG: UDP-glucose/GDP-mannose dehydrogenase family protein [Candidatus Gastranaerophilales bacterium]|nr:UDP-glucose/GDP-mannose dehydrogenase family protein [Candidatus Gastranaerophilales bacterium]
MNISIIGTGYVGLPTGVGFASLGHNVCCIDKNIDKVERLNKGQIDIYEDNLKELFDKTVQEGKLTFAYSIKEGIQNADLVILAVGTPTEPNTNKADLTYIKEASKEIAECEIDRHIVIAIKSTVPVGTGDMVEEIINNENCDIVSMPEFLREGFALHDFFNPDRIVIGTNSEKAKNLLQQLYQDKNVLFTDRRSSELIKYASNAFLALKIHYINEIADLCEKAGANVEFVAKGMGLDSRIGNKFLNAGIGFGGSCFPKDTKALLETSKEFDSKMSLVDTVINGNNFRKMKIAKKIADKAKELNPHGEKQIRIAIYGLAFKNNTDDCRESPAIEIIQHLLNEKDLILEVYDPKANENAKKILGDKVNYYECPKLCAYAVDMLVILTEWEEFKNLDYKLILTSMRDDILLDYRNLLDEEEMKSIGFKYERIGKKYD